MKKMIVRISPIYKRIILAYIFSRMKKFYIPCMYLHTYYIHIPFRTKKTDNIFTSVLYICFIEFSSYSSHIPYLQTHNTISRMKNLTVRISIKCIYVRIYVFFSRIKQLQSAYPLLTNTHRYTQCHEMGNFAIVYRIATNAYYTGIIKVQA